MTNMPLLSGKKNIGHNIKMEDKAGKPHKQSLAIALSVARRGKGKRMADGGGVGGNVDPDKAEKLRKAFQDRTEKGIHAPQPSPQPMANGGDVEEHYSSIADAILAKKRMAMGGEVNAKYEARPMPDNEYNDSGSVSRNSGNKAPSQDSWTDNSTVDDAQRPSPHALKQPQGGGSKELHDDEDDLQASSWPESDRAQPKASRNELGPNRQGPKLSDSEREHSNGRMPYHEDEEDQYSEDMASSNMKKVQSPLGRPRFAEGGMIDEDNMSISDAIRRRKREQDHPDGSGMVDLEENSEEMPNQYDELDGKAAHEEQYDDDQISAQPEDSNEHGGMSEEDEHDLDLISSIRKKMKKAPR